MNGAHQINAAAQPRKKPLRPLDYDTADQVRNMVRYIKDDERIARYLACDIRHVQNARAHLPMRIPKRMKPAPSESQNEVLELGKDAFTLQAIQGSQRLAAALAGAG